MGAPPTLGVQTDVPMHSFGGGHAVAHGLTGQDIASIVHHVCQKTRSVAGQ